MHASRAAALMVPLMLTLERLSFSAWRSAFRPAMVSCRHQCSVWRRVRHRTSAGYAINCMSRNTVPPICSITTVTPTTSLFWVLLPTGSVHHSGVPRHSSYSYLDLAAPGAGLLDEGAVLACLQQLLLHPGRGKIPRQSIQFPSASPSVGHWVHGGGSPSMGPPRDAVSAWAWDSVHAHLNCSSFSSCLPSSSFFFPL